MGNQIGIVEATGDTWKALKKSITGPFSLIRLKKSISLYNECYKHMLDYIDGQINSGNPIIDGAHLLHNITVDVMASVGLGIYLNTFKDPNNEFKKRTDSIFEIKRWQSVEMLPSIAKLFRIQAFNPGSVKFIEAIIKRAIKKRKSGSDFGKDILGSLIKLQEDNPGDENFDIILKTYIQFMADGNFATADLLGATIYYIIAHPEIYERIIEEQNSVFDEGGGKNGPPGLSSGGDDRGLGGKVDPSININGNTEPEPS